MQRVDWMIGSLVNDNVAYVLFYQDPVLLAVNSALMEHWMMLYKASYQVAGHFYYLHKALPLEVVHLFL